MINNNIEKEIITDLNNIQSIKNDWNELLKIDNNDGLYVNPEIFTSLFEGRFPNCKPYIVLFRSNKKPVALIVGVTYNGYIPIKVGYFSTKTPTLKSLDIEIGGLITDGQKESEDVIIEYLGSLLYQKKFEKLEVTHLSETHKLWEQIKNGIKVRNKSIYTTGIEWIGRIRDASTGERFSKNSSRTRANFRRKDKKLLKYFNDRIKVITLTSIDEVEHFIKMADSIGKKSYQYAIEVGVQDNNSWRNLLKAMAEKKYFRGYLLMHNSIPISYIQGLVFKDIFYLFATSFDPQYKNISPGGFLLRKVIELLVEEKINSIHYGYGDAEYKRLYGTESYTEASFRIYGFTTRARISKFLDQVTTVLNEKVKNILLKTGLLNKIKRIWRTRLSKKR